MKKMKIILASGSPRRKELLSWSGVEFEVKVSDVDETPHPGESPAGMVKRLSLEKARKVGEEMEDSEECMIIAADTTVVSPKGKILGKPEDFKDAYRMISEIQGKTHEVLTGYSLIRMKKKKVLGHVSRVVKTRVSLRDLSPAQRRAYLDRGESMDKAGAYAAQGYGMVLIEKIQGSYTNVVGLPMAEVLEDMKQLSSY